VPVDPLFCNLGVQIAQALLVSAPPRVEILLIDLSISHRRPCAVPDRSLASNVEHVFRLPILAVAPACRTELKILAVQGLVRARVNLYRASILSTFFNVRGPWSI
jgi:hypothetical protein